MKPTQFTKHVCAHSIRIMSNIILHITRNAGHIFFKSKTISPSFFFQFSNEMHFYFDLTWGSLNGSLALAIWTAFHSFVVSIATFYQNHCGAKLLHENERNKGINGNAKSPRISATCSYRNFATYYYTTKPKLPCRRKWFDRISFFDQVFLQLHFLLSENIKKN